MFRLSLCSDTTSIGQQNERNFSIWLIRHFIIYEFMDLIKWYFFGNIIKICVLPSKSIVTVQHSDSTVSPCQPPPVILSHLAFNFYFLHAFICIIKYSTRFYTFVLQEWCVCPELFINHVSYNVVMWVVKLKKSK